MAEKVAEKLKVASGVDQLDFILEGLFIGDNVVWYDDAGSLASVFCLNFIKVSQAQKKPLIYVTFDRSPKNLLEKLGPLAQNPALFILDCFTFGKGAGSPVFLKFYEQAESQDPFKLVQVGNPRDMSQVTEALYTLHGTQKGDHFPDGLEGRETQVRQPPSAS